MSSLFKGMETVQKLFRLPVNLSSQLYKSRFYNIWEGKEKSDDSIDCRNKSNDSIASF